MVSDYRYFKVTGGKVREIYDDFMQVRAQQLQARADLFAQTGAINALSNSSGIIGLSFPDAPPADWRRCREDKSCWRPPLTKEGKALAKRMRSMPVAGTDKFNTMLGCPGFFGGNSRGFHIAYIYPEVIGDTLTLKMPNYGGGEKWKAPDEHCVEIKASEFHSMKEQLEEITK